LVEICFKLLTVFVNVASLIVDLIFAMEIGHDGIENMLKK